MQTEHERRLELYQQGLNDREIGEAVGLTASGIKSWRGRHGLPTQGEKGVPNGASMQDVLDDDQVEKMKTFLSRLVKARDENPNLGVGEYIGRYRKYELADY